MQGKNNRVFLIAFSLFVLFAFLTSALVAQGGQPKFSVKQETVNVGEVLEGEDVVYDFVVKNLGTADLEILSVRPG